MAMHAHRFQLSAAVSDFLADDSDDTIWSSDPGATPVMTTLGFTNPTPLSKMFISFTSELPTRATLEFFQTSSNAWISLQHFALNCSSAFGISPNQP